MMEQQTYREFTEVFKPGLVNGFNSAIVHSSSDVSVKTMMATVQEIAFDFQYSSNTLLKMDKIEQELHVCGNDVVNGKLDGKFFFVRNSLMYSCKCINNF